ncbi:MAG: hypothetical protein KTR31_21260 [Myxococcales bacterium]|nr:hypothetical protein [Myxococcales bacterium]
MRLLVAVDLTDDDAADFVRAAGRWIEPRKGRADLLYVNDVPAEQPFVLDAEIRQRVAEHHVFFHERMGRELHALLDQLAVECRGQALCVQGEPVPEILARVDGYDAVVLGHRPLKGAERHTHGVIAQRVAVAWPGVVLLLPRYSCAQRS